MNRESPPRGTACTSLIEKPLEITTKRADALIDAAEAAGVQLGVFFQDRLRPAVREMKAPSTAAARLAGDDFRPRQMVSPARGTTADRGGAARRPSMAAAR